MKTILKEEQELLVMKLIHYFVTEKNYNPVIVHGIDNEIWLENMNSEFRIVRIVMNHIHNDEQLSFDNFKVEKLTHQIKLKTFTLKMKTVSFYLDINEDVSLSPTKINYQVVSNEESDLKKSDVVKKYFPDMTKKLIFTEEGEKLYEKINDDIIKKNVDESNKINDLFKTRKPFVTYGLIAVITIVFALMYILGNGSESVKTLYEFGALVKGGSPLRLITSIFLHIGIIHYAMNVWALYILGKQTENFYGHFKTFLIFMFSGIVGNLFSLLFMGSNSISAGASGAIFGLMGALLYFALNERTYMGEALKNEILPVIIVNLFIGVMVPSINMFAHIGGLISGIIISIGLGVKYKSSRFERVNGLVASVILVLVLGYLAYFK